MHPGWQVALAFKGDVLAGTWPYFLQQKWGVSFWRNPPLTPYLGPQVYFPKGLKPQNQSRAFYHTAGELLAQLKPLPAVCSVALEPAFKGAGVLHRAGLEVTARQTFLLSLDAPAETLLQNTHESVRRSLRQAAGTLEIVEAPTLAPLLWEGQQATLKRKGAGAPAHNGATLERAVAASVAQGQGMLWAAQEGPKTAALLWAVWDAAHTYYLASTQFPGGHPAAVTALIWHAIEAAGRRGNTVFDFEGSMNAGIEHFFRGFGGRPETYLVAKRNTSLLFKAANLFRR